MCVDCSELMDCIFFNNLFSVTKKILFETIRNCLFFADAIVLQKINSPYIQNFTWREKHNNVLQTHIVIVGQVHILVFLLRYS